jgi:hypothetical protein
LEIVLVPCQFYKYFFKYGDYSSNTLLKLFAALFFVGMAYWSHTRAGPPNDPGYLEWENFRTEEELKDLEDKKKWSDPSYAQKKQLNSDDPENINTNTNQCDKCGCMKVDGVHHCSKCQRCVYKMDHHCPWINNCVGYYTLKPFLLFLTYVSVQCFLTCYWMYKAARVHNMEHVSFISLIPAPQLKMSMKLLFSNSEEKKLIQAEAEK